jgi:hypothetical protein
MNLLDRRQLICSSSVLLASGCFLFPERSSSQDTGSSPTVKSKIKPLNKDLFNYLANEQASLAAKAHRGTMQAEDYSRAAEVNRLYAAHLEYTGYDTALIRAAADVKASEVDLTWSAEKHQVTANLVQRYDSTFTVDELAPKSHVTTDTLAAFLADFKNKGIANVILRGADAMDATAKRLKPSRGSVTAADAQGFKTTYQSAVFYPKSAFDSVHLQRVQPTLCKLLDPDFCENAAENIEQGEAVQSVVDHLGAICAIGTIFTAGAIAEICAAIGAADAVGLAVLDLAKYLQQHCCVGA